jgi:hypothetical protein
MQTRKYSPITWWLALIAVAVITSGCAAKPPPYSDQYKAKFERRTHADEGKARAFVNALAALPVDERKAYAPACVGCKELIAHSRSRTASEV